VSSLKLIWVRLVLWHQNFILGILQATIFSKVDEPSRILIFRTGSIGDNICAMPAIVAIRERFVDARIDILTTSGARSPVSMERLLSPAYYDELIDYTGTDVFSLLDMVRKGKYNLVIELPQNMVSFSTQLRNLFFF
jgi:ADP-heptose:LPS heptosyltransferase